MTTSTGTSSVQTANALFDPTDPAYKKAHRLHLKSTKQRPSDDSFQWTPFRAAEKKYKSKFPPPDLSEVLDLSLLDGLGSGEDLNFPWRGSPDAIDVKAIRLKGSNQKGYTIPQIPGTFLENSLIPYVR